MQLADGAGQLLHRGDDLLRAVSGVEALHEVEVVGRKLGSDDLRELGEVCVCLGQGRGSMRGG